MVREIGRWEFGLPVTLNGSYGVRGGRLYMRSEAVEWKHGIGMVVRASVVCVGDGELLGMVMVQHLVRDSRDVDGNVKLVMDGVCSGLGVDDRCVRHVVLSKVVDGRGVLEVVVYGGVSDDIREMLRLHYGF